MAIEVVDEIQDIGTDIKKKFGKKGLYIVGGVGVIGAIYLLTKSNSGTSTTSNASEVTGYPSVDENSDLILDKINDLSDEIKEGKESAVDNADKIGGADGAGGSAVIISDNGKYDDSSIYDSSKNIVERKILSDSSTADYDTDTTQGAFDAFYDEVTGGGVLYSETDINGNKKAYYSPNKKAGVDSNNDGQLTVSKNKNGNTTNTELNNSTAVHTYDGKVYVDKFDSSGHKTGTTTYNSAKDLPTYTGKESSSGNAKSVTVKH